MSDARREHAVRSERRARGVTYRQAELPERDGAACRCIPERVPDERRSA